MRETESLGWRGGVLLSPDNRANLENEKQMLPDIYTDR